VELDNHYLLHLFEFLKIVKIGGAHSPCACMEWPGIQILQAILSLPDQKRLRFTFIDDTAEGDDHTLHFYERNPARRGMDFNEHPEDKLDLVRYAVELRCQNPVLDTKRTPMPPLEDLAEAAKIFLTVGLQPNMEPRKELKNILQK
jgi:hypothetical protein